MGPLRPLHHPFFQSPSAFGAYGSAAAAAAAVVGSAAAAANIVYAAGAGGPGNQWFIHLLPGPYGYVCIPGITLKNFFCTVDWLVTSRLN